VNPPNRYYAYVYPPKHKFILLRHKKICKN